MNRSKTWLTKSEAEDLQTQLQDVGSEERVCYPIVLERYSHEGYLITVVEKALAGKVARELSPIRSWSNNNYDLKLAEKGKGTRVASLGSDVT